MSTNSNTLSVRYRSSTYKRLRHEWHEIQQSVTDDTTSNFSLEPFTEDLRKWKGNVRGPAGSAYEGGNFQYMLTVGPEYPLQAPTLRLDTKIWHPNISSEGILEHDWGDWCPALTLEKWLVAVTALLSEPDFENGTRNEVLDQYVIDPHAFTAQAREWTQLYAIVYTGEKVGVKAEPNKDTI